MHVVVVTGDALSFAAQHASILEPVPHAVQNDDFVPEGSFRRDRGYMLGPQCQARHLF